MPMSPEPPTSSAIVTAWREVAPEVLSTFRTIESVAARCVPATIGVPVRAAIGAILCVPPGERIEVAADERTAACVQFAEQFVVDVAGLTADQRTSMLAAMENDAFVFVQFVYVADVFTRARIAIEMLFGDRLGAVGPVDADSGAGDALWPLLERFMQQVALLSALDPLTTELVRLRGAQVHNCRLCQSRRSVKALDAAPDAGVFEHITADNPHLTERERVALALADALVTQPRSIDAGLITAVHAHFDVAAITEIVYDVARNAANKIAVALGGDAPVVSEGVEFYDIDESGEVVADVDIDVVRGATAR